MGYSGPGFVAPDSIAYMDAAAETAVGRYYKRQFAAALDVSDGQTVVDIGCGPGTDLGVLADAVGPGGRVIGVDHDPEMLDEARRRLAERAEIELRPGDIHDLPLPDASADRVRVDRVLMHVLDPASAIAGAGRVLRPDGWFGMAEPDWDTLVVADEDRETSRGFARFLAGRVRNPSIGRELPRLCIDAGLRVRAVEPVAALFEDFATADQVLGLRRNSGRAVQAGMMGEREAQAWLRRQETGPVVAAVTCFLVIAGH